MKKILAMFAIVMSFNVMADSDVEKCVTKKIESFHKVMGEDEPISMDMLEEWEYECDLGGYTDYVDPNAEQVTDPEIKLYVEPVYVGNSLRHMVKVQSMENNLTVKEMIVNRGNCTVGAGVRNEGYTYKLPLTLNYGESASIPVTSACDIVEITLKLNDVSVTYNVD